MVRYATPRGNASVLDAGRRAIEVSAPPAWLPPSVNEPVTAALQFVATLEMAMAAAISGAGIATLPDFMAVDAVESGRLAVFGDRPSGPFATITAAVATGVDAGGLLAEVSARLHPA